MGSGRVNFKSSLSSYISSDASSEQWGHTPFTIFSFILLAMALSNFALLPTVFTSDVELPANITVVDFFVNPFRSSNSTNVCNFSKLGVIMAANVVVIVTWCCVTWSVNKVKQVLLQHDTVASSRSQSCGVLSRSSVIKQFKPRFLAALILMSMVPVANLEASNHTIETPTCSWEDMPDTRADQQLCFKSESPSTEICVPTPFHTPLPFLPDIPDYLLHGPTPKHLVSLTPFHSKFPTDHLGGVRFVAVWMGLAVFVCPVPFTVAIVLVLLVYPPLFGILRAETRHAMAMYRHLVTKVFPIMFDGLIISANIAWRGTLFILTYTFNILLTLFNTTLNGAIQLFSHAIHLASIDAFNILLTLFNTTLNGAMQLFSHAVHLASINVPQIPYVSTNVAVNMGMQIYFSIYYGLFVLTPSLMQLCLDLIILLLSFLLLLCGVVSPEAIIHALSSIFILTLGVVVAVPVLKNLIGWIRLFLPMRPRARQGHAPARARQGHAPARARQGHAPFRVRQGHAPVPLHHNAPIHSAYVQPSFGALISHPRLLVRPRVQLHVILCYEISGKPVTSAESEGGPPVSYEHSVSHDSGISCDDVEGMIPDPEELCGHQHSNVMSMVALVEKSPQEWPYSCDDGEPFPHFEDQPIQEEYVFR